MKKETIKQYPIVRYLCLLLVVALLFAGVTFSRYQSRFTSENSVGVAEFDASYTIDSVNTTSFGNTHFWQLYNGFWMDQGSGTASTVRITMYNNSAIDLRPTIRMEGPAEFWENIALQITPTTGTGSNIAADTENPLTTQLVIADLVKERTEATQDNEHVFEYDKYRQWSEGETFNTSTSDNFGQLGSGESTLAMTGGITESDDGTVSGSVTATRQSTTVGKVPETRPENNWNMTITASMKNVDFSLGFTRQQGSSALPALYLDCTANVPYYTIEIDIPMELKAKSGDDPASATYVMYLNWTNAIQAKALGIEFPTGAGAAAEPGIDVDGNFWTNLIAKGAQPTTITANGTEFTVLGYHFNYTDVPYSTSAGGANAGDTTVRLTRNFANGISYQHIARLNENDAVSPHDIEFVETEQGNGYYRCSGDNPAYFEANTINSLNTNFFPATLKTMQGGSGNDNTYDYVGVSEKGYTTRISVNFVQTSVLPATGTTSTTF